MAKYGYPTAFGLANNQTVAIGSSSVQSPALTNSLNHYRIISTCDSLIEMGTNPSAVDTSAILPAYTIEYLVIPVGQKIAVKALNSGTSGNLHIADAIR
jgi:hypothetical protein